MTQQTNGTPDLKYSEETFRELYEVCKRFEYWAGNSGFWVPPDMLTACSKVLTKAKGGINGKATNTKMS